MCVILIDVFKIFGVYRDVLSKTKRMILFALASINNQTSNVFWGFSSDEMMKFRVIDAHIVIIITCSMFI